MNTNLDGQTVVVLGAAKGIGFAIAEQFAAERAKVALVDISADVEQSTQQLVERCPQTTITHFTADVSRYDDVERVANAMMSGSNRVDHVVFAVGIGSGKFGFPFWNLKPSDWRGVYEVNVMGAVHAAHAFAPAMIEAKRGTFLFLSSVAGQIGSQTDPPYSASKAALINFAQCAAKDLAPHGVRVNTICPGMIQTDLNRAVFEAWNRQQPVEKRRTYEDWAGEKVERVVPLRRWQTAADIANMAVFLASDLANNITGQTINVDGGFVMHW